MAGPPRTRRTPARSSAQRTRERLLHAGRKVFAAKGLGGASLRQDILARAGVSTGSFYHQFRDKEDLLVEILRRDGQAILEAMGGQRRESPDVVAQGTAQLQALFRRADRHPDFVKIFVREYYSDSKRVRREIRKHSDRTIAGLEAFYEQLAAATDLPLDARGIATLIAIQVFAVMNYYLDSPKSQRDALREQLVRQMMSLLVGGVLAVRKPGRHDARRGGDELPELSPEADLPSR